MGIYFLLLDTVQVILTAGLGGVLLFGYAFKDLLPSEENPQADAGSFADDYQELMRLAERQRQNLDAGETQRFFQLRQDWSRMHSYGGA